MSPVTVPVDNAFTLAACAEMIYLDKPFLERVDAIAARGLKVEIWDWTAKDLQALAARRGDGVEIVSMTGYVEGDLTTDEGIAQILSTAEDSLRAAEMIDCPRLNFHGTGLGEGGIPVVTNPRPSPARDQTNKQGSASVNALVLNVHITLERFTGAQSRGVVGNLQLQGSIGALVPG